MDVGLRRCDFRKFTTCFDGASGPICTTSSKCSFRCTVPDTVYIFNGKCVNKYYLVMKCIACYF